MSIGWANKKDRKGIWEKVTEEDKDITIRERTIAIILLVSSDTVNSSRHEKL
jgi:hypothetical protein